MDGAMMLLAFSGFLALLVYKMDAREKDFELSKNRKNEKTYEDGLIEGLALGRSQPEVKKTENLSKSIKSIISRR